MIFDYAIPFTQRNHFSILAFMTGGGNLLYHIPFERECSGVRKNAKNIFLQNLV
jgi:hypothetical protein